MHATALAPGDADRLLEDYVRLIKLASPEIIPPPSLSAVKRSGALIRHLSDVPVLLSAIAAAPDFFITHNITACFRNLFTLFVSESRKPARMEGWKNGRMQSSILPSFQSVK